MANKTNGGFTAKEVGQELRINPQTKRANMAWKTAADVLTRQRLPRQLVMAADGILYALNTGRVNGTVAITFRSLTPYQSAKVLADVANNVKTMAEVGRYLNEKWGSV